ncbi:MAG: lipoyl synthase [Spirochaetia bacterium]|nr:lipoyl synthase [Spirochaetia bacterium]
MKVRLKFATETGVADHQAQHVKATLADQKLVTVCQEASCPNLGHCWGQGTATFMIMGERCTRRCGFCNIQTARPQPLDPEEPRRLVEAARSMNLRHVVVTSVDRDDLKDCGSTHFAEAIHALRTELPKLQVEVLIPDFKARVENLERIWAAKPHIINHNVETVPSLYKAICPQSNYEHSLTVLRLSREKGFLTKSGIILGLGETTQEVENVIRDLHENGVVMLTIGQYLQPTPAHAPLARYADPREFESLKAFAYGLGFRHVEAGPLVRSSYHAGNSADLVKNSAG